MSVVAAQTSPLNCRWVTWNDGLPVCTHPPGPPHRVSEAECSLCEHWTDEVEPAAATRPIPGAAAHPRPAHAHDGEGHFVPQNYLTEARRYYEPTEQGVEKKIKERLDKWRALTAEANPAKR